MSDHREAIAALLDRHLAAMGGRRPCPIHKPGPCSRECPNSIEAMTEQTAAALVTKGRREGRAEAAEAVRARLMNAEADANRAIDRRREETARANAAERKLAAVVAAVEALADEWERDGGAEPFAWLRLRSTTDGSA